MNKICPTLVLLSFSLFSFAQTCTLTGSGSVNWPTNGTGISCAEGGNAFGKTTLVIPAGLRVVFGSGDTWTGTEIQVNGTLDITFDVQINSSVVVNNGGLLDIGKKLALGTAGAGCSYNLTVYGGGTVTVEGTGSDRLTICGVDVMQGNGACNDCGGTNSARCPYDGRPYCQPTGGFTGPTGFDDDGYNPALPVALLYFNVTPGEQAVNLSWATSLEENFSRFVVQRSADGLTFNDIGDVKGRGFDRDHIVTKYDFDDEAPLVGVSYYRLKAIDLDDSYEHFPVRTVTMDVARRMAVYPNPSKGEVISFRTNFTPGESDKIIVIDPMGVEVLRAHAYSVDNNIFFNNRLLPGIYTLRYVSDDFEQISRVVVGN